MTMTDETAATEEIPEVEIEDAPAASDGDDATETTESEESVTPEGETEEKAEKPKRANRGVQKRIDKLTKQVREQERLIEELRKPREEPKSEPKRDDYEDYEQYLEDKAVWKVEQRLAQEQENQRNQQQANRHREQQAEWESRREDIIDAGLDAFADFEEVAMVDDGSLLITEEMADAILQSDAGHELWYHLGKHPAKAQKIASLPSTRQVLEIGRLEASLKSAKLPSNAPPPTKPVGSRAPVSTAPSTKDSITVWMEKRNRQIRG